MTESFALGTSHWISVEDRAAVFIEFSLSEKEEKHSERQTGQRDQSIFALLKVKGEGGGLIQQKNQRKIKIK